MTKKKKILLTVGLVLGLPTVGLGIAALMVDSIVKSGTETAATAALQVPTKLEAANIKYAGKATLNNFEIANPPGYKEPRAVAFEKFDASMRVGSLMDDVVEVNEVLVSKPDLTVEFVGLKSNWSVLMDNLSRLTSPSDGKEKEKDKGPGKKYKIAKVRIEGATVRFRSDLLPVGGLALPLPTIELKDIGGTSGGSMSEVLGSLMNALGGASANAGNGKLPDALMGQFRGELGNASKVFKGAMDSVQQQLKDAPAKAVDAIKKDAKEAEKAVEKGVKDLFEMKKK